MTWRQWSKTILDVFRPGRRRGQSAYARSRGQVSHVIILDGTMSSLSTGCESNAGLAYKLLSTVAGAELSLYYEAGIQWCDWRRAPDVITGKGINRQIRRAYGYLASRYRPGDKIYLMGYSRGAFAVRSLAGVIDRVGLLRAEEATERNIRTAYRHYQAGAGSAVTAEFAEAHCHEAIEIEMIGVWDTVKALGFRMPIAWRWMAEAHAFHDHRLGASVRHGYHALALDETRRAFEPVLWETAPGFEGKVEQVWFRGTHGDVGGQLGGFDRARPLSNISFVWMMERAESCGVALPEGWKAYYEIDAQAPSVGTWRGWGKIFWFRKARDIGGDSSESVHPSASQYDERLFNAEIAS
ncbi:hypothetical protein ROA7450_01010 [Roseovarius albus]|uniref:T6SS Phospholipase effector Tle1-like catalytic domain-containing protein n=1 Tax=Roseovarius albus TaxID=1247867 RepID=A0A1X6YLN7_9RHOB|nr:DUF2235 domain-containing protein [Roseovarius albus]SLN24789.1 hypothetical protein ROA7450_01010 [Roseovarius albus]